MKTQSTTNAFKYAITLIITVACFQSSAQQDYYWVGGTGDWSDYANHWATTSGGSIFHTSIPTDVDDVYFDENSFTAPDQVVRVDEFFTQIARMDWSEVTYYPTIIQVGGGLPITIKGSLILSPNMHFELPEIWLKPSGVDTKLLNTDGLSLENTKVRFQLVDGVLQLEDSLSTKAIHIEASGIGASLLTNGQPIHCVDFSFSSNINATIDFSNSTFYSTNVSITARMQNDGSVISDNTTLIIIDEGGETKIDRTKTIYPFFETFVVKENHLISAYSPNFYNLKITPGVELLIDDQIDGIQFQELMADGTLDFPISIKSNNEGQNASLIKNGGGEVNISYTLLKDIEGIGAEAYNAQYSLDHGNVTGINFFRDEQEITTDIETKDYEDIGSIYVPAITASSGLDILLESSNEDVAEIVNGNELLIQGMGTTTITANQSGNIEYNPAVSVSVELEVTKADQYISFEIPDTWIGDVFINLGASSSSGLDVLYHVDGGNATIENDVLTFTGTGPVQVRASQTGDDNYNAAEDKVISFEVFKADQTITLADIPDIWIGDESVGLSATSDSGLDISYHVLGPAETDGNNVVFNGSGTVQVTASQAGDDNYNAADDEIVTFEVYKKAQTITFAEIADISEDAGFVNLDATSDSGLLVTYSVVGPGEVVDGAMEFTGNGMVQVTAMQAGGDLYLEAEQVRRSFEIIASDTEKPLFLTQPEGLGSIYPNPVADYLHFDPQLNIETIHITDLAGKVYYEGVVEGERLDMSSWEVGTYILTINTTNGEEHVARILKH